MRKTILGLVLIAGLAMVVSSARADVTLTPNVTTLSFLESDAGAQFITYTLTNNGPGPIQSAAAGPLFFVFEAFSSTTSGDGFDQASFSFTTSGSCGLVLAEGSSCTIVMGPPSLLNDGDADSWTGQVGIRIDYIDAIGLEHNNVTSGLTTVTVTDDVVTPEPTSLLLLGTGLLGLGPALRRFRRA